MPPLLRGRSSLHLDYLDFDRDGRLSRVFEMILWSLWVKLGKIFRAAYSDWRLVYRSEAFRYDLTYTQNGDEKYRDTLNFSLITNLIMSGDISKQIQSINKQLASVGPAVQVGNFLGVSPFAGVAAVGASILVALLLFLDVFTGVI
jgi:hypothetical protein